MYRRIALWNIDMSRIAKIPITVPTGIVVLLNSGEVKVKGPIGELRMRVHPFVKIIQEDGVVKCAPEKDGADSMAQVGTARSLIANMITGVSTGFEKELQLVGVGYRAQVKDKVLTLSLGYSQPINYRCPEDVSVETPNQTRILVRGMDKQRVGQTAAEIRSYRPPEPYKGKGVRYSGEIVVRKEAKKKQKQ